MKSFMKFAYALCIAMCLTVCVNAQNYSIKGIVKDAKTGKVLSGASVKIHGTTIGCVTNTMGEFSLENLQKGEIIIKAGFAGYATERSFLQLDKNITNFIFALEKSMINLDEVTVTGTGSHYKLKNSPVQTELISRKTIENIGTTSVENLLTTVSPSFDFSPSAGMGTFAHINGLGSKYITFLVDGRKMTGDISGNIDHSRINTENIEKIEIVKGASSSLYGSDAIGGIVNIITKKNNNNLKISSNTQAGENGNFSENASVAFKIGKVRSYTNYNYKKSDYYTLTPEFKDADDYYIYGTDSKSISQNFKISLNKALSLNLGGTYYKKKMFTPQEKKGAKYDYHYDDVNFTGGAKYLLNKKDYIQLDINHDVYNQEKKYFIDYKEIKAGDFEFNKKQTTTNVNLKGVFKLGKRNTVVTGIEYKNDILKTSEAKIVGGEKKAYTTSIYAQDVIKPIENLSIIIGARGIKHKTFGSEFTPKLSAMYKLYDFNIRATYSQGFKTPTLQELYYDYESSKTFSVGNENLNPEKSKYYNISIELVKSWLNASVSIYRNDINDMIQKMPITEGQAGFPSQHIGTSKDILLYSNIAEARSQGIDFNFNSYLGAGLTIGGGYSYVDAKDLETKNRINRTGRNYANIRLAYDKTWNSYGINLTLTGKYQDGKFYSYTSRGKQYEGTTPEFNIWRLSTNHRFYSRKSLNLSLMAGIDNIFDYVENNPMKTSRSFYYGTLTPGRTFFFGVKIEFNK